MKGKSPIGFFLVKYQEKWLIFRNGSANVGETIQTQLFTARTA